MTIASELEDDRIAEDFAIDINEFYELKGYYGSTQAQVTEGDGLLIFICNFHILSNLLLIYICNFHVLSNLLLIYICKLHWNYASTQVTEEDGDGLLLQ